MFLCCTMTIQRITYEARSLSREQRGGAAPADAH